MIYGHIFMRGISVNCFFDVGFHLFFDVKKAFKFTMLRIIYSKSEHCAKIMIVVFDSDWKEINNETENDEKNA